MPILVVDCLGIIFVLYQIMCLVLVISDLLATEFSISYVLKS